MSNQTRDEQFRVLSRNLKIHEDVQVLLFGTSIIKRLRSDFQSRVWHQSALKKYAFNMGVGGTKAQEVADWIGKTTLRNPMRKKPHTVLIHCGSNDAENCSSAIEVAHTVMDACSAITLQNPFLTVIISAVLLTS